MPQVLRPGRSSRPQINTSTRKRVSLALERLADSVLTSGMLQLAIFIGRSDSQWDFESLFEGGHFLHMFREPKPSLRGSRASRSGCRRDFVPVERLILMLIRPKRASPEAGRSSAGHPDVANNAVLDRRAHYGRIAPPDDKLTHDSAATSSRSIRAAISGADEDSSLG
ncbi:hypothetical protein T492DRAFT_340037 [Pavlovales sp. CCMP2436]|nr:hypothetical protein T492DRAFT_340037 [Pavlovales sp. CCMP2436]